MINGTRSCATLSLNAPAIALTAAFVPTSLATLLLNALLIAGVWKVQFLHRNLRCLLTNGAATAILVALGFLSKAVYNGRVAVAGVSPTGERQRTSALLDAPFVAALLAQYGGALLFTAERLRATCKVTLVEKAVSGRVVPAMLALCWLVVSGCTVAAIASIDPVCRLCYRSPLAAIPQEALTQTAIVLTVLECATIAGYATLAHVGRRQLAPLALNTAQRPLLTRLQIWNNIKITDAFLPVLLLHCVCWMPSLLMMAPLQRFVLRHPEAPLGASGLNLLTAPALGNALLFPIVCAAKMAGLRAQMHTVLRETAHWIARNILRMRLHTEVTAAAYKTSTSAERPDIVRRTHTQSTNSLVPVVNILHN